MSNGKFQSFSNFMVGLEHLIALIDQSPMCVKVPIKIAWCSQLIREQIHFNRVSRCWVSGRERLSKALYGLSKNRQKENFAEHKGLKLPFNLTLSTANWNPAQAETNITVSWDYAGQTVSVGEVLAVTFILEVGEGADKGSFSNDIVIMANEA